ncbi:phage minor capsid protein [Caldifermentibacillus hisashii]|uniref:phage minor capsid protein n=1 Tax=Caldifermentibacillus hisashii TaxID=996558 RepID=UPI003100B5D3
MDEPKEPKITPYQLDLFTEPVADIYRALEDEIFLLVVKRLKAGGIINEDDILHWQVERMQELRMLNQETIKALAKATGIAEKEIIKAIEEVGYRTIESVDSELKYAFEPLPIPNHIDTILATYVQQTFREIDNLVNQTLITTNYGEGTVTRMYRKIVEETTGKVLAGTTTINKAVAETVIKWADKGIETAFIDKGGHVWSLERYADTVIRSTVNRTYNELRMSRMEDYGVDLVLVSSHPDPREACAPIQGKVASIKPTRENKSKHPSIYEFGYGEPAGLRGINCRHMFYPFVEGLNVNNQIQYDEATMKKNRELSQKQRYYERQVRKAKRSLMLAEEIGDEETIQRYKRLVRSRQAKVREFVDEHGLIRRYDKERVIVRGGNHS